MMQYKNKRTGVVITTPCTVSGGDWVSYDTEEQGPLVEVAVETNEINETKEQVDPETDEFDGITKAQIIQELEAFGVDFDKKANKQTLYDLMMSQGK